MFYIVLSCFLFVWYAANNSDFFLLGSGFLMIATFKFYSIQPYKDQLANLILCFFLFLLSLQYLTIHASRFMVFDNHASKNLQFLAALMALLPITYLIVLVFYQIFKNTDCGKMITTYCRHRCHHVQQTNRFNILRHCMCNY